eukprot:COSAG02_NODE_1193_length_13958_cov_4.939029_12_plen_79_part_00
MVRVCPRLADEMVIDMQCRKLCPAERAVEAVAVIWLHNHRADELQRERLVRRYVERHRIQVTLLSRCTRHGGIIPDTQ